MLRMGSLMIGLHVAMVAVLCLGLSGISVGLGARLPNLQESDPSKIAAGFGGTLNLLVSLVFIFPIVTALALPCHLYFAGQEHHRAHVRDPLHGGSASGLASRSSSAWSSAPWGPIVPLRIGIKAFQRMEFKLISAIVGQPCARRRGAAADEDRPGFSRRRHDSRIIDDVAHAFRRARRIPFTSRMKRITARCSWRAEQLAKVKVLSHARIGSSEFVNPSSDDVMKRMGRLQRLKSIRLRSRVDRSRMRGTGDRQNERGGLGHCLEPRWPRVGQRHPRSHPGAARPKRRTRSEDQGIEGGDRSATRRAVLIRTADGRGVPVSTLMASPGRPKWMMRTTVRPRNP